MWKQAQNTLSWETFRECRSRRWGSRRWLPGWSKLPPPWHHHDVMMMMITMMMIIVVMRMIIMVMMMMIITMMIMIMMIVVKIMRWWWWLGSAGQRLQIKFAPPDKWQVAPDKCSRIENSSHWVQSVLWWWWYNCQNDDDDDYENVQLLVVDEKHGEDNGEVDSPSHHLGPLPDQLGHADDHDDQNDFARQNEKRDGFESAPSPLLSLPSSQLPRP